MADDFNLTPTNNLEKHLDNILRTAQGGEPQYDLSPNWRTEQYLAAIASALASGGGGGSGGGFDVAVFTYANNAWTCDKTYAEIAESLADRTFEAVSVKQGYITKLNWYQITTSGSYGEVRLCFVRFDYDTLQLKYDVLDYNYERGIEVNDSGYVSLS